MLQILAMHATDVAKVASLADRKFDAFGVSLTPLGITLISLTCYEKFNIKISQWLKCNGTKGTPFPHLRLLHCYGKAHDPCQGPKPECSVPHL